MSTDLWVMLIQHMLWPVIFLLSVFGIAIGHIWYKFFREPDGLLSNARHQHIVVQVEEVQQLLREVAKGNTK